MTHEKRRVKVLPHLKEHKSASVARSRKKKPLMNANYDQLMENALQSVSQELKKKGIKKVVKRTRAPLKV